jgi:hypothetical protein
MHPFCPMVSEVIPRTSIDNRFGQEVDGMGGSGWNSCSFYCLLRQRCV